MKVEFKNFFNQVMRKFTCNLLVYGCVTTSNNDGYLCHSKKFAKTFLTLSLFDEVFFVKDKLAMCGEPMKGYVYATEGMIKEAFNAMDEDFFLIGKNKAKKSIKSALCKHFSVMYREMAKCFPSTVIFIGANVGSDDYDVYAKQQFLEGKPIDVRRLKKIKEQEGIVDKKSGLANVQE